MNEKKGRIVYFDILNIMACFGVVWLHCSGDAFTFRMDKYWLMSLGIQVICHWAVPIFFMLTGANLLNYREKYSTKVYFKRRFLRIFIPFFLWSTIYLIWKRVEFEGVSGLISLYLNNGIEGIFWFFYPLFSVYICIPVLSIFTDEKYKKELYYTTGIAILALSFFPLLPGVFHVNYSGSLNPPIAGEYVMYVLLGWILKNEEFTKKTRYCIYATGIFGAVSMAGGTILLSLRDGTLNALFWDYLMFPTLFMACALFLLLKHCRWKVLEDPKVQKTAALLSSASFGVYLIHIRVVSFLVLNEYVNGDSRWWMMFGAVGVYAVCVTGVLIRKNTDIEMAVPLDMEES